MGDKHLWLRWKQIPNPGKYPARRRERMLFTASGLGTFGVSFGSDLVLWSVCVYSPACVQRGGIVYMQTCKRNTNRVAIHIITLAPYLTGLLMSPEETMQVLVLCTTPGEVNHRPCIPAWVCVVFKSSSSTLGGCTSQDLAVLGPLLVFPSAKIAALTLG